MRKAIATALIRLACRVLEGHDDRLVVLNTKRKRNRRGPEVGKVPAFLSTGRRTALGLDPDLPVPSSLGTPVPAQVAKLAGWRVES